MSAPLALAVAGPRAGRCGGGEEPRLDLLTFSRDGAQGGAPALAAADCSIVAGRLGGAAEGQGPGPLVQQQRLAWAWASPLTGSVRVRSQAWLRHQSGMLVPLPALAVGMRTLACLSATHMPWGCTHVINPCSEARAANPDPVGSCVRASVGVGVAAHLERVSCGCAGPLTTPSSCTRDPPHML